MKYISLKIFKYACFNASDKNVEGFNNIYFQEFGHQETKKQQAKILLLKAKNKGKTSCRVIFELLLCC